MWTELYDKYIEANKFKHSEQNNEQNSEVNVQCMWQEIIMHLFTFWFTRTAEEKKMLRNSKKWQTHS